MEARACTDEVDCLGDQGEVKDDGLTGKCRMDGLVNKIDENGNEIVIFDEELINAGSVKWNLTLCGYFFHNEDGMKYMYKKGHWMVNGKPFIVQKWDINICLDKTETVKLHVWIKLCNVPLEAWTIEGISALASRLLIEIDASKELLDVVEVEYRNALKEVIWAGHNDDSVRKNEGMDDDGFRNVGKKSNNEKLAYQPKTTGKYMENRTKKEDEVNERVHSSGNSIVFADMHDFNDCVNQIEVEDICSSGLNFTWTKNLQRVKQDSQTCDFVPFQLEISGKEVKDALFDIGDNKAPDPDGYTALFFKKAWPVIGNDVVNVVREFFNTGGRGLRQGEPISPSLFIVVMEVFNLIMQRNIVRDKNFHYHFGCKKLKITHVCFADDLIMFYHGDDYSLKS
ncbi:RNA-directed DNA polymerase, eukaryota, reverse transcriptase zinc-binding domain protein [Tanacetum coccineum]